MDWNFEEGRPIYSQIVEQMKIRIANGDFQPGDRIPPVREIAVEAGVNPNTMQRAMAQLEREGLLYSVRTRGRFVTEEESVLSELKQMLGRQYIQKMVESLEQLGMNDQDILQAVQRWIREQGPRRSWKETKEEQETAGTMKQEVK